MTSGRRQHQTLRSPAPPSVSRKTATSSSPYQHPRQISSEKEFASRSLQQKMDHQRVQSSRYAPSSAVSQHSPLLHYSQRPSVLSREIISSRQSEMLSSTQVSAQPASLVTLFEEGQQSPPSLQASHVVVQELIGDVPVLARLEQGLRMRCPRRIKIVLLEVLARYIRCALIDQSEYRTKISTIKSALRLPTAPHRSIIPGN